MKPRLELSLHAALHDVVGDRIDELAGEASRRVRATLDRLGVPGAPSVEVVHAGPDEWRAVRVVIDGAEEPYPPSFLARLWHAVAPHDLREQGFDSMSSARRRVHAWLIDLASHVGGDPGAADAFVALLARLAAEVVSLHPAALLTDEEAAGWFEGDDAAGREGPSILRELLELGVSLRRRSDVVEIVRASLSLGRSRDDAFEETFAALRSQVVEVHVDRATYDALIARGHTGARARVEDLNETARTAAEVVREHPLRQLAVDVPIEFVSMRERRACEMRIVINDRRGPPVPLPSPDEVGVSVMPGKLARVGITGRRLIDPVTGAHLTAVPADQAAAVTAAGFTPVAPAVYLVGALARNLVPLAHRLIAIDGVERQLAHFEPTSPALVQAALDQFSLMRLSRLFRELVREAVPVDDLARLLNAVLRFCEFEDEQAGLDPIVAYVRRELCDRIVVEACGLAAIGSGVARVYETTPAFEAVVEHWLESPPADSELRAARHAVGRSLAGARVDGQPVIVTSAAARRMLRAALDHEVPDVQVLARTELIPGFDIVQVGSIG
jgi:hypothetical protein